MLKLIISLSIIVLSFTGCGSGIGPIASFQKVPLQKASLMPSKEEINGSKTKIVLTRIDDSSFKLAMDANLGESLRIQLENKLNSVVDVIDRNIAKQFDNEINNDTNNLYDGALSLPKYAISGKLSNSGISKTYYKRWCSSDVTDICSMSSCRPAYYSFKGSIFGIFKIHELPSMKVLKIIEFEGNAYVQQQYSSSLSQREKILLINSAGSKAIKKSINSLKNFFSKKGYVIEKRIKEDETILKISLGIHNGLSQGDKVIIYNINQSLNPLTNVIENNNFKVSEGLVTNELYDKHSWIIITDSYSKVKLGDQVKIRFW